MSLYLVVFTSPCNAGILGALLLGRRRRSIRSYSLTSSVGFGDEYTFGVAARQKVSEFGVVTL